MNDDSTTLQNARKFLASDKPASITPIDICQIAYLILWKGEDHPLFPSQQTLGRMFGVDAQTIMRSQAKLERLGWLSRPQRRGKTNALSLMYQNIPSEGSIRTKITPDAQQLAFRYQQALKRFRKKFPAQWLPQQFVSAQRVLDLCSGDPQLSDTLISYALSHPKYGKRSRMSLYNLLGKWEEIVSAYSGQLQAQEQQKQAQERKQEVTIQ